MGGLRSRLAGVGHWQLGASALCIITAAVCALYLPFISNPLVFDDKGVFSGSHFADYASFPFGPAVRFPAYFSLAFVYVIFGTVEAQRVVGLLLHAAVGFALFVLIRELLRRNSESKGPHVAALTIATLFVVHP